MTDSLREYVRLEVEGVSGRDGPRKRWNYGVKRALTYWKVKGVLRID